MISNYMKILNLYAEKMPCVRIGQFWSNFADWCSRIKHKDIYFIKDEEIFDYAKEYIEFYENANQ